MSPRLYTFFLINASRPVGIVPYSKIVLLGGLLLTAMEACQPPQYSPLSENRVSRVVVSSEGWELIGDLTMPSATQGAFPAVLLLNKAAGDRRVYAELAAHLATRGIASLRLDLPGHGESTNLGAFEPGSVPRDPMIWDAEVEIAAAVSFLGRQPGIDPERLAVVGASYSGEEMAEAGRNNGNVQAYVALSPGSFEDESIDGIDQSGVPWLFIHSRDERFLIEIAAAVRERSQHVELLTLPGSAHATDLLEHHPDLAERIAVWLQAHL